MFQLFDSTLKYEPAVGGRSGSDGELIYSSLKKFIDNFNLNEESKVLDMGCGRGKVILYAYLMYRCMCYGVDHDGFRVHVSSLKQSFKHLTLLL